MIMNFIDAAGVLADSAELPLRDLLAYEAKSIVQATVDAYDALAPDWSQAPEWARWSAIHANGLRYWMEKEPSSQHGAVAWDNICGKQEFDFDCDESLPIGLDWRLLKWQRPEVAA